MSDQATELRRLVERHGRREAAPRAAVSDRLRRFAVVGARGGVGATTLALELGGEAARRGWPTLLIDAAPSGDAALRCQLAEGDNLSDVLSGRRTLAEAARPVEAGFRLLASAWGEVYDDALEGLQSLEEQILQEGEATVVFDCGDSAGPLSAALLGVTQRMVLLSTSELPAVMAAYAAIKRFAPQADPGRVVVAIRAAEPCVVDEVGQRLQRACQRFLGRRPAAVTWWPDSPAKLAARRVALEALLEDNAF